MVDVYGSENDDKIKLTNEDTTVYISSGKDFIYSGKGNNTYIFNNSTSAPINTFVYSGKGVDTFDFSQTSNDILYSKSGKNLVITYNNNVDKVTVVKYFSNPYKSSFKNIILPNQTEPVEIIPIFRDLDFYMEQRGILDKKNNLSGSIFNDRIFGGNLNDTIKGGEGRDIIYGISGKNKLYGQKGNDIIYGGYGNDYIDGGEEHDILYDEAGNNTIKGGAGNDVIVSNGGNDKLYGGIGNNMYYLGGNAHAEIYSSSSYTFDHVVINKDYLDSIKYSKSGNDLVISYNNGDFKLKNYFKSNLNSLSTIIFTDFDIAHPEGLTNNAGNYDDEDKIHLGNDIIRNYSQEYWDFYFSSRPYDPLTVKANVYNGNDNKNLVAASGKYCCVNTYDGDDIIYMSQSKIGFAEGGAGSDTYVVKNLKSGTVITDTQGNNDVIEIGEKSSNVNIIFDVCIDDNGNITDSAIDYSSMLILNNATYKSVVKTGNFYVTKGISVEDPFREDTIETIKTKDAYVTIDDINAVRENVANWLDQRGYNSAIDALYYEDSYGLQSLLSIYQGISWHEN